MDIKLAHELDAQDELAPFCNEFVIADPNLIYLDGNSLTIALKELALPSIATQPWLV